MVRAKGRAKVKAKIWITTFSEKIVVRVVNS